MHKIKKKRQRTVRQLLQSFTQNRCKSCHDHTFLHMIQKIQRGIIPIINRVSFSTSQHTKVVLVIRHQLQKRPMWVILLCLWWRNKNNHYLKIYGKNLIFPRNFEECLWQFLYKTIWISLLKKSLSLLHLSILITICLLVRWSRGKVIPNLIHFFCKKGTLSFVQ